MQIKAQNIKYALLFCPKLLYKKFVNENGDPKFQRNVVNPKNQTATAAKWMIQTGISKQFS